MTSRLGNSGGISPGSAPVDVSVLPSSPEHMGLKAHAAEFVPKGGAGGKEGAATSTNAVATSSSAGGGKTSAGGGQQSIKGSKGSSKQLTTSMSVAGKSQVESDLTASAQEFVPGGSRRGASGALEEPNGEDRENGGTGLTDGGEAETSATPVQKMVQVVRGGTIYFVPASEALATDELIPEAYETEEENGGFLWAHESSALPAPQRRTMHR